MIEPVTALSNPALFAIVALTSALVCLVVVLTQRWHGHLSNDHDLDGAQKFHERPVPRVGGIGFAVALLLGGSAVWMFTEKTTQHEAHTALVLLLCGVPAFVAGLVEDMTKSVSVSKRLLATFASAALTVWLLDAKLKDVDTVGLDTLMLWAPIAIAFTCFAVAGVANAVNIIDGFNGLASGSVAIMLGGLAILSWQMGDLLVMQLCLLGAAAAIGFLLINYPTGQIFLGDGGAYLAGFWLAECAVLLLARNPDLSTWTVLLVCAYPVFETAFSIWRKSIHRKTGAGKPDKVHFHMLVYRRVISQAVGYDAPAWVKHGLTSLMIWSLVVLCVLFAVSANAAELGTLTAMAGIGVFVLTYILIYRTIVRRCMPSDEHDSGDPVEMA